MPRRASREAGGQDLARGDDPVPPPHRARRRPRPPALELLQRHQAPGGARASVTVGAHNPEAVSRQLSERGTRAVRLLYSDLHGVARGKDIPIGHFAGMCEEGVAFCSAVMGTDLRHTPVVGGAEGYTDFAVRPD